MHMHDGTWIDQMRPTLNKMEQGKNCKNYLFGKKLLGQGR